MQHLGYVACARPLVRAVEYTRTHELIRVLSSRSTRMLTRSTLDGRRNWDTLASHICSPPPSIRRRRRQRRQSSEPPLCQTSEDHLQLLGGCGLPFYSGTANNSRAAMNYSVTIGPDSHVDESALPVSTYAADVGYFIDSTAINTAGSTTFQDPLPGRHADGSPLPPGKYATMLFTLSMTTL